jgi:F420 biosynthesis protein FbiB-like protein
MSHNNNLLSFLKSRRSTKNLRSGKISQYLIEKILEVAISAPSAHNSQPWRFLVINNKKIKNKLAYSMVKVWEKDLLKDGLPKKDIKKLTENSIYRIKNSSVVIIVCLCLEDVYVYTDTKRNHTEYLMAVQSVAASIENLLLAIHAKGLGACWRCAPLFCPIIVKEVLNLPNNLEPHALIEIGYIKNNFPRLGRKSLKEFVQYNQWVE